MRPIKGKLLCPSWEGGLPAALLRGPLLWPSSLGGARTGQDNKYATSYLTPTPLRNLIHLLPGGHSAQARPQGTH